MIMRELGLVACQPGRFGRPRPSPATPVRSLTCWAAISPPRPGRKLVGDITFIRTWEGWLYLATVLDCFSKKV